MFVSVIYVSDVYVSDVYVSDVSVDDSSDSRHDIGVTDSIKAIGKKGNHVHD
jgi:hypothetical protein